MAEQWSPGRAQEIKRTCISMSVGRFVRAIEEAAAKHDDGGQPVEQEAKEVLRKVIIRLAGEEMGESAIFMTDTPQSLQTQEWGPGTHTPESGYELTLDLDP